MKLKEEVKRVLFEMENVQKLLDNEMRVTITKETKWFTNWIPILKRIINET